MVYDADEIRLGKDNCVRMMNYLECSDDQFRTAMKMCKEMAPEEMPTDLLYIAFTKYRADAFQLISAWESSSTYMNGLWQKTKKVRNQLGEELERRGIQVMY